MNGLPAAGELGRERRPVLAPVEVPSRALMEFAATHIDGPTTYPDPHQCIRFWDAYLTQSRDVEADWLPAACLGEFGQGIVAGAPK